jgi:hypothetical protein
MGWLAALGGGIANAAKGAYNYGQNAAGTYGALKPLEELEQDPGVMQQGQPGMYGLDKIIQSWKNLGKFQGGGR